MMRLIWLSMRTRLSSIVLAICSITISVTLLLAVEKLSHSVKNNFEHAASNINMIVAARNDPLNITLASLFHIGNISNNIPYADYEMLAHDPKVKAAIPISLGDSHKGHNVVGTNETFFSALSYGKSKQLEFTQGKHFADLYDIVLGAQTAKKLGYKLNDKVIVAHGHGKVTTRKHTDKPFTVVGILAPTGTVIDHSLFVPLEAISAIHAGWVNGVPLLNNVDIHEGDHAHEEEEEHAHEHTDDHEDEHAHEGEHEHVHEEENEHAHSALTPKSISAVYLQLDNPRDLFSIQRQVNNYANTPLSAVIPGLALRDLWRITSQITQLFTMVSLLVFVAAIAGLVAILLATLKERRREMAILRSLGASPWHIFILLLIESLLITVTAIILAIGLTYLTLWIITPLMLEHYGIYMEITGLTLTNILWLTGLLCISMLIALIPALKAYRMTLNDGLEQST